MPVFQRVPPAEPALPTNLTPESYRRYLLKLQAWFAGELLRTLYGLQLALPDDYPLPRVTASYRADAVSSTNYPSDQMTQLVSWLDRQQAYQPPLRACMQTLVATRPAVARALWLRHVDLLGVREIADREAVSERTVKYWLAYGNGQIFLTFSQIALHQQHQLQAIAADSAPLLALLTEHLRRLDDHADLTLDIHALSGDETIDVD